MEDNKMGKGNRNKLDRAQANIDSPEAYLERRRKLNKKQKDKTGLGVTITCIVLVTVIVLSLVLGALNSVGVFARLTNSLSTEHFTVTEAMMTFFYNDHLMNWFSNYQIYIMYGMYDVDFTADLREQPCSLLSNEGSWYDYFMDTVVNNVTMYLEYAEGAYAAGMKLDDKDNEEIDKAVDNIKKALKENGESIADRYGEGVSARDIRKCYEIIQLASKFNEMKLEELEALVRADGDLIEQYPEDHKEDFYTADYLSYTITVKSNDAEFGGDKEKFEEAKKAAKEHADTMAKAQDTESFFAEIKAYLEYVKEQEKNKADKTENESASGEESTNNEESSAQKKADLTTSAEEEEPKIEDYETEIEYGTSSDLEKWLFVDGAKDNDCKVIEENTTEKVTKENSTEKVDVDVYKVTAYIVKNAAHLDDALTMNIGYVITTDKALAEELRSAFMNGEMSAEALEKLGEDKYNNLPEGSTIQIGSGSSKNAEPDAFESTYKEFHEWLNGGRVKGEVSDVIEIKPTKDGDSTYYVVGYFEDWSDPTYVAQAINSIVNEKMDEWYQGADGNGGQLAATPVKKKEKSIASIDVSQYLYNLAYSMKYGVTSTN